MATGPALKVGDEIFPIHKLNNSVGRRDRITNTVPDVDLANLDTERAVSRKHAEMSYSKGAILLRDVGSTNGTTVNGDSLALQVDCYLQDGDKVEFGDVATLFVENAEWPEGIEAEWPPEPEPEPEPLPALADETAIIPPASPAADETAIIAPAPDETAIIRPDVPAPAVAEAAVEAPAEPAPAEAAPVETYTPPAAEQSAVFTPCTNHPHLPAVGICPGCLDPFCVDCLPERPGQPLTCTRCAGIQVRLGVLVEQHSTAPAPGFAPAPGYADPAQQTAFAPPATGPQQAEPDKKKKWPF